MGFTEFLFIYFGYGWNGGEWWMGGIVWDKRQIKGIGGGREKGLEQNREIGNRFALKERERDKVDSLGDGGVK